MEKSHNARDVVSMVSGKLEPKAAHCLAILKSQDPNRKNNNNKNKKTPLFSDSLIASQNKAQTHIKNYDNKSIQHQSMA